MKRNIHDDLEIRNKSLKKSKVSKIERWEEEILTRLSAEYKERRLNYWNKVSRATAVGELIRYAVNDQYASLVSFGMGLAAAENTGNTAFKGDDEFFAVVLLLAARGLSNYSTTVPCDEAAAISLFYSIAALLEKISLYGQKTCSAALIVLDRMEKWSDLRPVDERSNDIDQVLENLRRVLKPKLKNWYLEKDRMFINEEDEKIIEAKLSDMYGSRERPSMKKVNLKYMDRTNLVSELNFPSTPHDYKGSPFNCGYSEGDYAKKFNQQQEIEELHLLRLRNFCRNSKLMTAEKLIEQWKWKENIEKLLLKKIKELKLYALRAYLEKLDVAKCASLIYSAVVTACSSGQKFIVYSQLVHSLGVPVLDYYYDGFVKKLGINRAKIVEKIFLRYAMYFNNDEIARKFTVREWWIDCCFHAGVNPELNPPFSNWNSEIRSEFGDFFLSVVMEACYFPNPKHGSKSTMLPAFCVRDVSLEEESAAFDGDRFNLIKMVQIDSTLMDLINILRLFYVPPRPWLDNGKGGPSYNKSELILRPLEEYKLFDINVEVTKRLHTSSQARPVFDALNDLGSTPWKINKATLSVLKEVFSMTEDTSKEKFLSTLSVPLSAATVSVPNFIQTFGKGVKVDEINKEDWIKFSKAAYEKQKRKYELNSLWYWMMYRIAVADSWKDEILYFPHNMDFRGRVYPISPYLSHMGDDINRSLLLFAKGKPLGDDGLKWLKIHCVNLTGKKKRESINARLAYADEMLPKILDSANSPLKGQQWWLESDEPWQTLAACIELRNALKYASPEQYISHLPIHQDGTCNGLQHYAALGRDSEGAKEVNVLPSEKPSDVYSGVAQRVEIKRSNDEINAVSDVQKVALSLRKALPDPVPRKLIKQTVMTTVYGVTMYGAVQQIKRQLKALGVDKEESPVFARYLAEKTFLSLDEAFASSMKIKDWFRNCAATISREFLLPVEWTTPLGLPVIQPYVKMEIKHGKLIFVPFTVKQVNAFPPNFVHSLDSTHMMLTALHCRWQGLTFAAVHDCYWTHACTVDIMNQICRKQFVRLHKQPLVEQCGKNFISKYLNNKVGRLMSRQKYMDLKEIFTPHLAFGDLDIEQVHKSVYFFS
uniref:DNA-directed RNA polymerase n=1 Tax=Syphacia muris TaxID=451379 RepID=A0A0N5AM58_9BILA